jgi:hypothetical protein
MRTGKGTKKSQRIIEENIERGKARGKSESQATGVALRKARTAASQRRKGRAE